MLGITYPLCSVLSTHITKQEFQRTETNRYAFTINNETGIKAGVFLFKSLPSSNTYLISLRPARTNEIDMPALKPCGTASFNTNISSIVTVYPICVSHMLLTAVILYL
jgi:hypothetical protein